MREWLSERKQLKVEKGKPPMLWESIDFFTHTHAHYNSLFIQMYHKKEEEDKERLEQSQSADEDDPEPSQETSASSISAASPVHESSHGDVYLQPTDSEEPMETTEVRSDKWRNKIISLRNQG